MAKLPVIRPKPVPPKPPAVAVKVAIDVGQGAPTHYVNWIEISHTKWDFCLTGAVVPARHNKAKVAEMKASGLMSIPADVQLILPPTLIPGLIRALTTQKEKFEQELKTELKEPGQ